MHIIKKGLYRFLWFFLRAWPFRPLIQKFTHSGLSKPFVKTFAGAFSINTAEAAKELYEYRSLSEFFTRELKPEARNFDSPADILVSPVDCMLKAKGKIKADAEFEVKGEKFNFKKLICRDDISGLENGDYLILYLRPEDYHRIHCPIDAEAEQPANFGYLSDPVNDQGIKYGRSVFDSNYRSIIQFTKEQKAPGYLVAVGAVNVNSIVWLQPRNWQKGLCLGYFDFGSTVIMLLPPGQYLVDSALEIGQKLKAGEILARYTE